MTTRADRDLNGHDLIAGRANGIGMTLVTKPRHFWPWLSRGRRAAADRPPGSALIGAAGSLLLVLGLGLLVVSLAAQYRYVLAERHQTAASMIEAAALDVGLVIFSLLALGLARAGQSAKVERALIVACAAGSALMNYAAADVSSPRSVLAFCMPPVFLAVVVDRVVVTIRRHVLGMREGRSPWAASGKVALYTARLVIAPKSTLGGGRRALLAAAPLPAAPTAPVETSTPKPRPARPRTTPGRDGPSKKAVLLDLYRQHEGYGDRARISRIATELAPQARLQAGTARTYLADAVRDALPAGEGDGK
jgi:hypothetical protein